MGNETSQTAAVTKDVNMDDFTDEYRCCKEEYRLKTSLASPTKKDDKKKEKPECNDKLVIPTNTASNKIIKDKLEYYLRDIRENISDAKAK